MGLILDSSVLIAGERQRFRLAELFAAHPQERFFIAAITATELLHGVERATSPKRKAARSALVEQYLSHLSVLDFDLAAARRHAALWAWLEPKGAMIGPYDLLIAATALEYDFSVATLNLAEFQRVPALRLADVAPYVVAQPQ
jgi:tRNA(fMet)-specific endonuclease VapC